MYTPQAQNGKTSWVILGLSRSEIILRSPGTVATNDNGVVAKGDAYGQTKFILQKISDVLVKAGFSLKDVVRTRMFVTDISKWEEYGRAHGEFFKDIKPVTSMIEVKGLIDPDYLIEIETTAIK